jgi:hypothetical protein
MQFYLASHETPVSEHHDLWHTPLPTTRQGNAPKDDGALKKGLTYGEYFTAVEAFVGSCPDLFNPTNAPSLDSVSIFLEKHGAFYHPSRIAVQGGDRLDQFVLNAAVSEPGRHYLENEYNTLKRLEEKYAYAFLPKVFACREIAVDTARTVSMFAGEWFGSFHEFHVSGKGRNDVGRTRVWDPGNADCFLSADQAFQVYAQAAKILTACYDMQRFEHVAAWHHAAGDFVVNLDAADKPQVKLVTVRRYAPMLTMGENGAEAALNGLLLFLLDLSIRMRLDRLDGVKEICWLDDFVVTAALSGFFQGLALQCENHRIPDGFTENYQRFLADIDRATLQDLFRAMAGRLPKGSADTPIVQSHIEKHVHTVYHALQSAC